MRNYFFIVSLVGLVACTKPNPNRCCLDPADCQANNIPVGSTCKDGLVCRGNQCIAETCSSSAECDSMAPYCVSGLCASGCTDDMQCPGATQNPGDQFCVGGACVACRAGMNDCPTSAPVCDMGSCRACSADSDCASTVCDVDTGSCIDPSAIRYASPTGVDANPCTQAAPCTIARAIAIADVQRPWVRLLPGSYTDGISVTSGSVNIVGTGATIDGEIQVLSNAAAVVRGLQSAVVQPTRVALCSAQTGTSSLTLRDVSDIDAYVQADNCQLVLHDVAIGELYLNGGTSGDCDRSRFSAINVLVNAGQSLAVHVTNSVAQSVSVSADSTAAVTATFAYDTFYSTPNLGPGISVILVDCSSSTLPAGVTFIDNIFYSPQSDDDAIKGTHCVFDTNVAYPQIDPLPGTSTIVADPKLVDPANGDFHLQAGSPAIDAAKTTTLDPDHDYDGTPRPQGARRDIGAFEYKP